MICIRRARALLLQLGGDKVIATHYVARKSVLLDELSLRLLQLTHAWVRPEDLFEQAAPRDRVAAALVQLIDGGFLVVEGTSAARDDEQFARDWEWGAAAGGFHFGLRGARYEDDEGRARHMAARIATQPRVAVVRRSDAADVVPLDVPPLDHPLLAALRRRRSRRAFQDAPVPLRALAECLFAGMAVVGHGRAGDEWLPVKMTPSGGARNPFDALAYAWNVDGLARGLYRYLPETHGLEPIATRALPAIPEILGDQRWFSKAGAVILLVASFRRTMWKYPHSGGLRVVLIEAGHIAQNMLVCAAHHGLAMAPTCAVSDLPLEELCGLDPIQQAVLHTVVLGVPGEGPSEADFPEIVPNDALPGWLER